MAETKQNKAVEAARKEIEAARKAAAERVAQKQKPGVMLETQEVEGEAAETEETIAASNDVDPRKS